MLDLNDVATIRAVIREELAMARRRRRAGPARVAILTEPLRAFLASREEVTVHEVVREVLGREEASVRGREVLEVARELRRQGWERYRVRAGHGRAYVYRRPGVLRGEDAVAAKAFLEGQDGYSPAPRELAGVAGAGPGPIRRWLVHEMGEREGAVITAHSEADALVGGAEALGLPVGALVAELERAGAAGGEEVDGG